MLAMMAQGGFAARGDGGTGRRGDWGTDHALARELWKTGNADARVLATMIADPAQATEQELDGWMGEVRYYLLADLLAGFVFRTPFAWKKMREWRGSSEDFEGQAGWNLLARLAINGPDTEDAFFEKQVAVIERRIHKAKNWTRHAMNLVLIAIGLRGPGLQKLALAAAGRIGKVEVDHGETGCVTPDAAAYIWRAAGRKRKRKNPRGGRPGQIPSGYTPRLVRGQSMRQRPAGSGVQKSRLAGVTRAWW